MSSITAAAPSEVEILRRIVDGDQTVFSEEAAQASWGGTLLRPIACV